MALIKLNARDMIIEVRTDDSPETWTEIGGLKNFNYNPSENEEKTDTTAFADEGNYNEEKMQKGAMVELEGWLLHDDTTHAQDPGQAYCADVWHELLGPESQGKLRFRHKDAPEWKVWTATCTVGESGGENNDKLPFNASFTRCGASTTVDVA